METIRRACLDTGIVDRGRASSSRSALNVLGPDGRGPLTFERQAVLRVSLHRPLRVRRFSGALPDHGAVSLMRNRKEPAPFVMTHIASAGNRDRGGLRAGT